MSSVQASVAKSIRKELKEKFPNVKFSVSSRSYAGGNSVDIYYTNGVPSDDIRKIVNKYEAGHFDGSTDCYNYYSNRDYPTTQFVQINRTVTNEVREKTKIKIAKEFGIEDINNDQEWWDKFHAWADNVVYRELVNKTI